MSAEPLLVTASGVFGSFSSFFTPTTNFTAPDAPWSLSFQVSSNPVVSDTSAGVQFAPVFTDFAYELNGSPVVLDPAEILFFAGGFNGLFNVCLDSHCTTHVDGLGLDGSQLYTGSELSPTIVPGIHTSTQFFIAVNNTTFLEPDATVTVSAVPEPRLAWFVVAPLLILASATRRHLWLNRRA
jgi:hypothetical protein